MDQMNISHTPVGPNRTSTSSTFVDNYFSNSGLGSAFSGYNLTNFPIPNSQNSLSNIVDVEFQPGPLVGTFSISNPIGAVSTVFGSHDYPPPWYAQTALPQAGTPPVGFAWSPLVNPANTPPAGTSFYQQTSFFSQMANVTENNPVIQLTSTANLLVGMIVTDNASPLAIAAGTTIASIDPTSNQITLSQNPVADASGDTLTFEYTEQQFVQRQFNIAPSSNEPTLEPEAPVPLQYAAAVCLGHSERHWQLDHAECRPQPGPVA